MIRTEYWNDPKARSAFKDFMIKIHNLNLSEWESLGYWDNNYTPFSFFSGEEIVSSICVYSLNAVINGNKTRISQLSGVGTLPEWRRKGLNRRLTIIGLEWARERHDGIFLFSSEEAVSYYKTCGFKPITEYVEFLEVKTVPGISGIEKLNIENKNELDKIYTYAKQRTPVSDKFSILNEKLLMFHVLHLLRNHVYEIPDLDCLVFYKREGDCLKIFDIVSERIPQLNEFYPYIADKNDRIIEFHFYTDKLKLNEIRIRPLYGNNPFVKDKFPIEKPVFPYTSRA